MVFIKDIKHNFFDELPDLVLDWQPDEVPDPKLLIFNHKLANELELSIENLKDEDLAEMFSGNSVPKNVRPVAMAYAGHQFGHYSPKLGDGRALLYGEIQKNEKSPLLDIHLKGTGRTPFSRGADGKATIGPMLREYLMCEAMNALNVPTTRGLSVVTTGESIQRLTDEPGAVFTRLASSHIRIGTFEYAARELGADGVKQLADYGIKRHYSTITNSKSKYLDFLSSVVERQANLIAKWMLIGFVHGVMNTDNTTISGETIDYGPCAFMDHYHENTLFSSIDAHGRYAYGNQPEIIVWNLFRLAETLLPFFSENEDEAIESAKKILATFKEKYDTYWYEGMCQKLGLSNSKANHNGLFSDLLLIMQNNSLDYTNTFRVLANSLRNKKDVEASDELYKWINSWHTLISEEEKTPHKIANKMDLINPIYIPRNHLLDEALKEAENGDLSTFNRLLEVVTNPYNAKPELEDYTKPGSLEFQDSFKTFCGT